MPTLEENIAQAISDFDDIEAAIEEKGVDVPSGTDTSQYGNLIRSIPQGGGVGIKSVVQTTTSTADGGENVVTVILTDDSEYTFKVKNGSKGSVGRGISKIEKTSTNNLTDTYTITYSDGTTSTYTVVNGAKGEAGVGIKSVLQTTTSEIDGGENVITVTLTDDTKTTFKVKNGSKGSAGRGISKVEKTSTSDLTDTYTITYTDSTTSTFTVVNGKNGTNGVGIKTVAQTTTSSADGGDNVITVTLTDGTTSTFKVKNGSKGSKGDAGNGIKSVEKTSTSGLVDTYTITFTDNTTATFTVTNGKAGANGTSVTVSSVTESAESGGENVVTFSDGKTLTVKNGKDGAKGDPYTLTEADRASIVQAVIESLGGQPVAGYFDDDNNIVLTSALADGTYTLKLETADGTYDLGTVIVETAVKYTITWVVDGVTYTDEVEEGVVPTFSGSTDKESDGEYTYTFTGWSPEVVAATADATYTAVYEQTAIETEPTTYTVTFVADGVTVATVEYEEGATSITEPTVPAKDGYTGAWESYTLNNSNITVNAVYTEVVVEPSYTNLADPSNSYWKEEYRLSISGGGSTACAGRTVTNFIPAKKGDTLYVKGLDITKTVNSQQSKIVKYISANEADVSGGAFGVNTNNADCYANKVVKNGDVQSIVLLAVNDGTNTMTDNIKYIRLDGVLMDGYASSDVIITINEEIS